MKRRDFLATTVSSAGLLVPEWARSAPACAPPVLTPSGGGTAATTPCGSSTAEADWTSRSTGAGVVWAHDFRTDAEVNAYRWTSGYGSGNDPNAAGHATAANCRRLAGDGPTGNCLEILRRAGTGECESVWWRPFAPCTAPGNGLTANDRAANGTIPLLNYTPVARGDQISSVTRGYYGHANYRTANFDGSEFYLQMRVKMDPRRIQSPDTVGKLTYISTAYRSLTSQELVTYSYGDGGNQGGGKNYFRIYGGWQVFGALDQEVNPYDGIQPGSDSNADWYYSGGWDTIMYHIVPGRVGVDETLFEVYAAHPGETAYTRIWRQTFAVVEFEWNNGWNAFIASTYNNGNNMRSDFYHRYAQIIFSKQFIPCPQV